MVRSFRGLLVIAAVIAMNGRGVLGSQAKPPPWHCDRSPLLITNVRPLGASETTSILISGGKIHSLGDVETLRHEAPRARTLNGRRAVLLPGLIDAHAHFDALPAAKHRQRQLDVREDLFPITMRQTLASGVTTARAHLSAFEEMSLMSERTPDACFPSPSIVVSGPGLLGGAPDVAARLMRGVKGPEDARAAIERLAQQGADWAALHRLAQFSERELTAIVDAARVAHIRLMVDTDSFEDLREALRWPVVSGEYLNRTVTAEYPRDILNAISERDAGFYVVPPVGYYRRSRDFATAPVPSLDPSLFLFVDDELATEMRRGFEEELSADEYIAQIVASYETHREKLNALREAGAVLIVGSDSGSLGQFHHDAIWQEMAAWYAYGIAPSETVAAATVLPARMLGRPDIGRLEPGARGDLVLVDGDVSAGEFSRANVAAVVKAGVVFVSDGEWLGPTRAQMLEMMR